MPDRGLRFGYFRRPLGSRKYSTRGLRMNMAKRERADRARKRGPNMMKGCVVGENGGMNDSTERWVLGDMTMEGGNGDEMTECKYLKIGWYKHAIPQGFSDGEGEESECSSTQQESHEKPAPLLAHGGEVSVNPSSRRNMIHCLLKSFSKASRILALKLRHETAGGGSFPRTAQIWQLPSRVTPRKTPATPKSARNFSLRETFLFDQISLIRQTNKLSDARVDLPTPGLDLAMLVCMGHCRKGVSWPLKDRGDYGIAFQSRSCSIFGGATSGSTLDLSSQGPLPQFLHSEQRDCE